MSTTTQALQPAAPNEEAVRQAVNRWSDQGSFRIKYLGDKIFIDEIRSLSSYTVKLDTEYEDRNVSRTTVPYPGGPIDDHGMVPRPWDMPAKRPTEFGDRSETHPVPHTETVTMCTGCAGLGRVDCTACRGLGRIDCSFCQGKGYRERQQPETTKDKLGNLVTQMVTVTDKCNCAGGRVSCPQCAGNGRKTCGTCAGSGRTKSFDQLTIHFRHVHHKEIFDATEIPDSLIGAAKGEVVVDQRAAQLESAPPVAPEVDSRIAGLVGKAKAVDESATRVLFQQLHIERVPVHEVSYRYAGESKKLWVYGTDQLVHAPGAPWLWKRAFGIVAGVVAGIAAVIVIAVLLSR